MLTSAGPAAGHVGHAVAGGFALLLAVVVLLVSRARTGGGAAAEQAPEAEPVPGPGALVASGPPARASAAGWVAVAVLGAATVHGAASRSHFAESAVLGGFFLLLTLTQFGYAAAVVLRPTTALLRAGLAANAAVTLLWAYTRVVGIPFGVTGGGREGVRVADLLATAFELAAVAAATLALRGRTRDPVQAGVNRPVLTTAQRLGAILAVSVTGAVVASTGIG